MKRTWMWRTLVPAALLVCGVALVGCKGDRGKAGVAGTDGTDGASGLSAFEIAQQNGFTGTEQQWLVESQGVGPETCSFCHGVLITDDGVPLRNGSGHQEAYDELFQQDVVQVNNIGYSNDGTNDTVTFEMTKNGADFDCTQADSLNIGFSVYDAATRTFTAPDTSNPADGFGDRISLKGTVTYDAGTNTCTSVKAQTSLGDLSATNGNIVVYGQDELVESITEAHLQLAKYPFAGLLTLGAVDYTSEANVTGCEQCHETPYYKHGYIRGDISAGGGLDFYACKVCHIDNGAGHDTNWQYSVDNPQGWANGDPPTVDYAYTTRLMNDVHMSHSMEFPYPQSMRNCATCHAGKLDQVLTQENFRLETCKSCHPVTGGTDTADANGNFAVDTTTHALKTLWANANVTNLHVDANGDPIDQDCSGCHKDDGSGIGLPFSTLHTGYDPKIYYKDANGDYQHYRDAITASLDSVTVTGTVLDIKFSAALSANGQAAGLSLDGLTPTVQTSFYGYDTKDFILSNHTRNANGDRMEKTIGTDNPLFTEVDTGTANSWEVTLDMAAYAADPADVDIPADITAGVIKKAEVIVRPAWKDADGVTVGLDAVSKTIDVTQDGVDPFVDNYFQGTNAIVTVQDTQDASGAHHGCNSCHDQLATTFHSGDRGGKIVVCRSCHVVTSGGSHLEGQSRSIDSYVHAIHRFQAFNIDEIDFSDPVEAAKYEQHIEFLFPDFATINCERCHAHSREIDNGMRLAYDVPDQSKSMPGVLSATDETAGNDIPATPAVVVGPAARACGACHRAQFIKEGDPGEYLAFNQHTKVFGYRVENDANNAMLNAIIDFIMTPLTP